MTSEQLYELCKPHISRPWWPRSLIWHAGWGLERVGFITPTEAEDLILGAAVRWLTATCYSEVGISSPCMGSPTITFQKSADSFQITARDFGSLLEAVLYACAAVEGSNG